MNQFFFDEIKKEIRRNPKLSIKGLGKALGGKSVPQVYRLLKGTQPWKPEYTALAREYIEMKRIPGENKNMVRIDLVELDAEDSLESDDHIVESLVLLEEMLPQGLAAQDVKIVRVPGDHCAPKHNPGEYVFLNLARKTPSPSGVFLIWTGLGFKLQLCEHVYKSDPPRVRMRSMNPDYPSEPVEEPLSEANIVGEIIGMLAFKRD